MTPGSVFRLNQEGYAAGLPVFFSALSAEQITLKDDKGNILRTFPAETPDLDAVLAQFRQLELISE